MKKSPVLAVIFVSLVMMACDDNGTTRDIMVVNNCDWEILASITVSVSSPPDSAYIPVTPSSGRTFKDLEMGVHYLHVKATDPDKVERGQHKMTIDKYDTWVVIWNGTYGLLYTR